MLFGANSLFNQGFIFIVTVFFVIIGFGYGIMSKSIKTSKDITDSLSYSLDGIGSILVLIFFASLFTSVFKESGIGEVLTAMISNFIGGLNFTGIGLILIVIALISLVNIVCPDSITKWSIMSATIVPLLMNASISPEFSQIIYTASDSITNGVTPLFTYFVIYLAFLQKYNSKEMLSTTSSLKYMSYYSLYTAIIMVSVIVGWYMIGIPTGIGAFPGVMYGA
jgi:aminobenzoyl-glutamate transport protein